VEKLTTVVVLLSLAFLAWATVWLHAHYW